MEFFTFGLQKKTPTPSKQFQNPKEVSVSFGDGKWVFRV